MASTLDRLLAAHGGAENWRRARTVSVHHRFGGVLWDVKGVRGLLDDARTTVRVQEEWTTQAPFGPQGLRSTTTPDRVVLETDDDEDETVEELEDPRASFTGHVLETPWTPAQLAYFSGYAMWTYLTEPWSLTLPGVRTEEHGTWTEGGETFTRLRVTYPASIATHSPVQTVHVDAEGLLRRRDYDVDIAGGSPSVHLADGFEEHGGLVLATRRRVFVRDPDGNPVTDPVIVSIDLDDVRVETGPVPA
ncbi:hypothetical protein [Kineococcus sp. SYSU DK002]|uniref:hypothetical protein n=1 Tax=Kineococcus sp. SYSU DK002 TaxID=3383123 RepID=UPI003D7CEDA7